MLVFIYLFLHNDLPGTKSDQLKELLFWTILFGPCLFPLSLIFWHCYQLSQGETNFKKFENVARSRVLNSLSVLTKSAVQVVLQTSILMITWHQQFTSPMSTSASAQIRSKKQGGGDYICG